MPELGQFNLNMDMFELQAIDHFADKGGLEKCHNQLSLLTDGGRSIYPFLPQQ